MPHQPKTIKGSDLEILYLHMLGLKNKEIAQQLSLSEGTISNKINSDWFRTEKAKIHGMTMSQIAQGEYAPQTIFRSASTRMAQQILNLADNAKNENVKLNAALAALDRGGNSVPKQINVLDVNDMLEKMSPEELETYAENGSLPDWAGSQTNKPGPTTTDSDPDTTVH